MKKNAIAMGEVSFDIPEGASARVLRSYGVGIDTHRDFIQVCVLVKNGNDVKQYEQSFQTQWKQLKEAGRWAKSVIETKSEPKVWAEPFTYTIESTSTYHFPVIRALKGHPCVVNPVLAGHTRRKTDVLDARLLAYQNMTGLWPQSFIPTDDVQVFRLLLKQRKDAMQTATQCSNRINNYILRFGHTIGSLKSVRSLENRALIEDMCGNEFQYGKVIETPSGQYICPDGIPYQARSMIKDLYILFDEFTTRAQEYEKQALEYAKELEWETDNGYVRGAELIKNLLTVPYAGNVLVLHWLAEIVTPKRFPTVKHVTAFCGCDPSLMVSAGKVTNHTRRKGNALLHRLLMQVGGACINMHKEPFGQWGYGIYKRSAKGGYKKASGAVGRRIVVSLYNIHKKNEPFSYEKYSFYKLTVPEMPVDEMGLNKRVVTILQKNSIETSQDVANKYKTGELHNLSGFGVKAVGEVYEWLQKNKK